MSETQQEKWNRVYLASETVLPSPCNVLARYGYLLPAAGRALDLACGLGGNGLYLARRGFKVDCWDVSPIALEKLKNFACVEKLADQIAINCVDISAEMLKKQSFDVIVVSHFLDRILFPGIIDALNPGGLLYYQTFVKEKLARIGPKNADYLLAQNELLRHFDGLIVRVFHDEGCIGNGSEGIRNQSMLVAQKKLSDI